MRRTPVKKLRTLRGLPPAAAHGPAFERGTRKPFIQVEPGVQALPEVDDPAGSGITLSQRGQDTKPQPKADNPKISDRCRLGRFQHQGTAPACIT